jgi:hypothetical protein
VSFLTVSAGRTENEGVGKQGAGVSVAGDGRVGEISNKDFQILLFLHHMLRVVKSRMVGYAERAVEISNEHKNLVDRQKRSRMLARNIKRGFSNNNNKFIYHQENH